jgi:Fe2+ or Zn2+ uptake regulation protein
MSLPSSSSEHQDNPGTSPKLVRTGDRRVGATHLRQQLLNSLADCRKPVTTAALLDRLRVDGEPACLTIEAVYRNLVVLHGRGQVRRIRPGGRHVSWVLASQARRSRGAGGAA